MDTKTSLLDTLASYGIRTLSPVAEPGGDARIIEIDGQTLAFEAGASATLVWTLPFHGDNTGFIHLTGPTFDAILLKGVFKDFVRLLTGELSISERALSDIASVATTAERMHPEQLRLAMLVDDTAATVVFAEPVTMPMPDSLDLRRLGRPKRPLTNVEYSMIGNDLAPDHMLYTRGPFTEMFPETLSHFAASTAKRLPNIINPLFSAASIKTHMPSIAVMANRLYMNVTNMESIAATFSTDNSFFFTNASPWLARNMKKRPFIPPKLKLLDVTRDEVGELLDELDASIETASIDTIDGEETLGAITLATTAGIAIYLGLWRQISRLIRFAGGNIDAALAAMYRCRPTSVFRDGIPRTLPRFLDPAEPAMETSFSVPNKPASIDDVVASFPMKTKLLHGKALRAVIGDIHAWLDLRDRSYLAAAAMTLKLRNMLINFGDIMTEKRYLKRAEQVFWFENEEIGELRDDEYLGNIPFTVNFRHWQDRRMRAQLMPPELFERDAPDVADIVERIRKNMIGASTFFTRSRFHRDVTGTVVRFGNDDAAKPGTVVAARGFSLPMLARLNAPSAIIVENASLLGHTAEFCTIHDIPFYDGIRFAPLILDGTIVTTKEDSITTTT